MSSRKIPYDQAYADRMYLWKEYGQAYDMTGGYVADEKFEQLLKNPTKAAARDECVRQIEYWFQVGTEPPPMCKRFVEGPVRRHDDPRVIEMAKRYWIMEFDFGEEAKFEAASEISSGGGLPAPDPF